MTSTPSIPPAEASIQGADLGYYSHFPVLARALAVTSGNVLELGMGLGSTPLLHGMCEGKRGLFSFETDPQWLERFRPFSREPDDNLTCHRMNLVTSWESWIGGSWADQKWSVAFIDCAPGEIRKELALRLKDHADFIVLHDHEAGPGAAYYYEEIIPRWQYAEVYRFLRPHTLILSDIKPFGLSRFEQGFAS